MTKRAITVAVVAVVAHSALAFAQSTEALEKNKALAHRFHMEVIQGKNLALIDEIFTADPVIHYGSPDVTGREKARQIALVDQRAFPKSMDFKHDNVVAEGNLVAFHWILIGVGESGEQAIYEGIDITRIENGKIAELWIELHAVEGQ